MSEEDELGVDLARTAVVVADTRLPETYLVVIDGELAGRRFRLHKGRMIIGAAGRGANNDIDLDLATLSARHAEVELKADGTVHLWDLDSSNGTYLNGEAINATESRQVQSGDEIGLGPDLTFQLKRRDDEDPIGSVSAARNAISKGGRRRRRKASPSGETGTLNTPPGISSDVPLGKILGYLVSAGIISCTLFGLLNDAFDFVGFVKGLFGGGG